MDQMKPSLYIDSKDLKAIKDWSVGQDYEVIVKMRMTSMSERENGTVSGSFEIESIMSPEADALDLENINNISGNKEFMQAAAARKEKDYTS